MSQKSALLPHLRYQMIKENIAHKTQDDIAKLCYCNRRTIVRDIRDMKVTGEWWQWLEYELHRLHREGKDITDETKYKEVAKLYGKQFIVSKEESTTEHKGEIVIKAWKLGNADPTGDNS